MNTDLDLLEKLIFSEPDAEIHLYFDESDSLWWVTNEWLCGGFAGRAFCAKEKYKALRELADYFDEHIGHDSIVGRYVSESGWPNLGRVKQYLISRRNKDDEQAA